MVTLFVQTYHQPSSTPTCGSTLNCPRGGTDNTGCLES